MALNCKIEAGSFNPTTHILSLEFSFDTTVLGTLTTCYSIVGPGVVFDNGTVEHTSSRPLNSYIGDFRDSLTLVRINTNSNPVTIQAVSSLGGSTDADSIIVNVPPSPDGVLFAALLKDFKKG